MKWILIIMLFLSSSALASETKCYKNAVLVEKTDIALFSNMVDAEKWAATVEGEVMEPNVSVDGKLVFPVVYKYLEASSELFDSICKKEE